MEKSLTKGDIVVLPFPFSDLSSSKKRPALVIANLQGNDLILAQITSSLRYDNYSVNLEPNNFTEGKLPSISKIRPNKIFTGDRSIVVYKAGTLNRGKILEVERILVKIITN